MKEIQLIKLQESEIEMLKNAHAKDPNATVSIDELISSNSNVTYNVLKSVGDSFKGWDGIEQAVDYVDLLKKVKDADDVVSIENDDVRLIKSTMEKAFKNDKLSWNIEIMTQVYKSFCI